eukprot:CAMPEP_0185902204 /NCGR_PEP_ID=MMETSP0196C-20130402/1478_1 /TAXON_ID=2932 /ORGANISM="Alexandrium fundyense, Strain CCMP1719" /LENGTH=50 /DNA_ID=CAMNT_0028621005 /DNA_START=176 /DNA_END=325 /DNA_ORIENTATION=-
MDVVSGVAVTIVCFDGAGAGFIMDGFVPAVLMSSRFGGPQASLRSGSGRG